MQELEKILEEIGGLRGQAGSECTSEDHYIKKAWEHCLDRVVGIILKHMNDGWIPVEERLPEEKKSVLVHWEKYDRHLNVTLTYLDVMWLDDAEEKVFETINGVPNGKVIAWRPLPEPYCPGRSGGCDCEKTIHKYIKSLGKRKSESIISYIYRKMKEGSNGY